MKLERILDENPTLDAYRISFLTNRYVAPLTKRLTSEYGLVWQEWVIVFCLAQMANLTAKEISEATGRPQNTISDAVRKLLRRALVKRKRDASDARAMILALTPKGRALYKEMLPRLRESEARIFGVLTRAERLQLDMLLGKLVHGIRDGLDGLAPAIRARAKETKR